jgi:hypothetical protein
VLVFEIFAKLTYKNTKNQEYFIKKNGYRLLEPFSKMQPAQINVLKPLYSILINCCDQNDYQLIFWCNGFVGQVTKRKNELVDLLRTKILGKESEFSEKEINLVLAEIEIYSLFLAKASFECGNFLFEGKIENILEEIILSLTNEKRIYEDCQFLMNIALQESIENKYYT